MKNIDLKELYWKGDTEERESIVKEIISRPCKKQRIKQGNVDLLLHIVEPYIDGDETVVKMVNGIFTINELNEIGITLNNE